MKYEIWHDNQEQWDANDIDVPDDVIEAGTPAQAAEQFASEAGDSFSEVIVRDEFGAYFKVAVRQEWFTRKCQVTTLEELCSP